MMFLTSHIEKKAWDSAFVPHVKTVAPKSPTSFSKTPKLNVQTPLVHSLSLVHTCTGNKRATTKREWMI